MTLTKIKDSIAPERFGMNVYTNSSEGKKTVQIQNRRKSTASTAAIATSVILDEDGARELVRAIVAHFGNAVVYPKGEIESHVKAFAALKVGEFFSMKTAHSSWFGLKVSEDMFTYVTRFDEAELKSEHRVRWGISSLRSWTITPYTPPRKKVSAAIRELAVGDHFTVAYDNGRQTKGVKVDAEHYYSYTTQLLKEIGKIGWAGTVTKENPPS